MIIEESINRFIDYFEKELDKMLSICNPLYSKILIAAMIDSLAHCVYPDSKVGDRFKNFIRDFSCWNDRDRVSLVQLLLNLKKHPNLITNDLCKSIYEQLANWKEYKIYDIHEVDPFEDQLQNLITCDMERTIVSNNRHAELLYVYRNNLVHEFRQPGYPIETGNPNPYYFSYELVYSLVFFESIIRKLLQNLTNYLLTQNIDPYKFYKFGTLWKTE